MFFPQAAPPPVSYSREVAPIMAFHCSGCHGSAGGFNARSYAGLLAGGSLGPAVIAGDPDASPLVQFIAGQRGEPRRMPLGSGPLSASQIALIRRWIAEGAAEDADTTRQYVRSLAKVRMRSALNVSCGVNARAYLELTVMDPRTRRALFTDVAALTRPGEPARWSLRRGTGWPRSVTVRVVVRYADHELSDRDIDLRVLPPTARERAGASDLQGAQQR